MRLNIASGTAVRFEPGQQRTVELVDYAGDAQGLRLPRPGARETLMATIGRRAYAEMFGPTVGDRVRLADTDLVIEVEDDYTLARRRLRRGGEVRRRQDHPRRHGAEPAPTAPARTARSTCVLTNALIIDHWGIVKADIGLKDGRIAAIGKAGNPDVQPGVDIVIGPGTEIIAGEGNDRHRRRHRQPHPLHLPAADRGSADVAASPRCSAAAPARPPAPSPPPARPGPWNIERMLQAADAFPMNLGFLGKGNASLPRGAARADRRRRDRPEAARGLGHDAGGDRQLPGRGRGDRHAGGDPHRHAERIGLRREHDRRDQGPHACAPSTPKARAAATRPTSCAWSARPNFLPSSTNPTMPYTVNTLDEHVDMLMVCHHLDAGDRRGPGLRRKPHPQGDDRRRGHPARPGRDQHDVQRHPGDGPRRRGHPAHLADRAQDEGAARRAAAATAQRNDNFRVKRYIAKYTINPAIAHGIAHEVGSIEPGKWADLVVWKPAFFGVKPALILKGGFIAAGRDGRPERVDPDAAAGALPADVRQLRRRAGARLADLRLAGRRWPPASAERYGLAKTAERGEGHPQRPQAATWCTTATCRRWRSTRRPTRCAPTAQLLTCEPATVLPMAQRYFLF